MNISQQSYQPAREIEIGCPFCGKLRFTLNQNVLLDLDTELSLVDKDGIKYLVDTATGNRIMFFCNPTEPAQIKFTKATIEGREVSLPIDFEGTPFVSLGQEDQPRLRRGLETL